MFRKAIILKMLSNKFGSVLRSITANNPNFEYLLCGSIMKKEFCSSVTVTATPTKIKEVKTSKAMAAYLERARAHDELIRTEGEEYQIGKRHLANMMGEDPETFTDKNIAEAIAYLLPSGLYDKRARPFMLPPEVVFPSRKAAEFDASGRPHHSMFYTSKPNFFKLLYDIAEAIEQANNYEDEMIRKRNKYDPSLALVETGSQWLTKEELEERLVETFLDLEYTNFLNAMNRLFNHQYSYTSKDFIFTYRKAMLVQKAIDEIVKPQYDGDGRMFVTTRECLRKTARGDVTIYSPGTGKISINDHDMSYFNDIQPREQKYSLYCGKTLIPEKHLRMISYHEKATSSGVTIKSSEKEHKITKGTAARHLQKQKFRNEHNYTQNLNKKNEM